MTRSLTPDEVACLLTQEEVNALPAGTWVWVKWSGGNGPFAYKILGHADNGRAIVDNYFQDELGFVGKEPYNTRVFLCDKKWKVNRGVPRISL